MRVSEISASREQFQAFGEGLMPILTDIGVEFSGEPEVFEVHSLVSKRLMASREPALAGGFSRRRVLREEKGWRECAWAHVSQIRRAQMGLFFTCRRRSRICWICFEVVLG